MTKQGKLIVVLVVLVCGGTGVFLFVLANKKKPAAQHVDSIDGDSTEGGSPSYRRAPSHSSRRRPTIPKTAPVTARHETGGRVSTPQPGEQDPAPKKADTPPAKTEKQLALEAKAHERKVALLKQSLTAARERAVQLTKLLPRLRTNPDVSATQLRSIETQIEQAKAAEQRILQLLEQNK